MPQPTDPNKREYMFCDDIKFSQKVVIFHPEDDSKFLVLKRSKNQISRPDSWDFPGGNVSWGENHEEALKREIIEETGLKTIEPKLLQIKTGMCKEECCYFIYINHYCQSINLDVKLSPEHNKHIWVNFAEFEQLETELFMQEIVKKLKTIS